MNNITSHATVHFYALMFVLLLSTTAQAQNGFSTRSGAADVIAGVPDLAGANAVVKTAFATENKKPDSMGAIRPVIPAAPIPVEAFAGTEYLGVQIIISKYFSPGSRFGFFNVTAYNADYKNVQVKNESIIQSFITLDIVKGLSVAAGALLNSRTGFRPNAGLQYMFANREFLLVIFPHFDLSESYNFELFSLAEYKPQFKRGWGLYTRLQAVYNNNTKLGFHERSFINSRLGVSYKNFAFGLGDNIDHYGPLKTGANNFGVFVKADLFN